MGETFNIVFNQSCFVLLFSVFKSENNLEDCLSSHFVRTMEMKNAFVCGLPGSTQVNSFFSAQFYELYIIYI